MSELKRCPNPNHGAYFANDLDCPDCLAEKTSGPTVISQSQFSPIGIVQPPSGSNTPQNLVSSNSANVQPPNPTVTPGQSSGVAKPLQPVPQSQPNRARTPHISLVGQVFLIAVLSLILWATIHGISAIIARLFHPSGRTIDSSPYSPNLASASAADPPRTQAPSGWSAVGVKEIDGLTVYLPVDVGPVYEYKATGSIKSLDFLNRNSFNIAAALDVSPCKSTEDLWPRAVALDRASSKKFGSRYHREMLKRVGKNAFLFFYVENHDYPKFYGFIHLTGNRTVRALFEDMYFQSPTDVSAFFSPFGVTP